MVQYIRQFVVQIQTVLTMEATKSQSIYILVDVYQLVSNVQQMLAVLNVFLPVLVAVNIKQYELSR